MFSGLSLPQFSNFLTVRGNLAGAAGAVILLVEPKCWTILTIKAATSDPPIAISQF